MAQNVITALIVGAVVGVLLALAFTYIPGIGKIMVIAKGLVGAAIMGGVSAAVATAVANKGGVKNLG